MIEFKILKKSAKSRARLGLLKTPHGEVETPAMVAVATQAAVKTLSAEDARAAKSQILICNTYHLHLRPGEKTVKSAGGLHKFMNWSGPLMTDSGGFQAFSLGFGRDFGISKILKQEAADTVRQGQQPKLLSLTEEGISFRSHLDGRQINLTPEESIRIQEALGADIMFALDECPPPNAHKNYLINSVARTHRWAERSLRARKTRQALYGIVQGGKYKELRLQSAAFTASLDFDGFGIGGELGVDKNWMFKMLGLVNDALPEAKPRHLLGNGYPEDIPQITAAGADTFDCVVPTHHARHGIAFTAKGKLDLNKSAYLKDKKPLDPACECRVCGAYSRAYLAHLFRAREITALSLTTFHNLFFFNTLMENMRRKIKDGKL